MSNDFENSQEYRKALEIAKKQEELYKNVTKAISPEALAKFQELSNKLSEWKNSLNNMPGLLKFAEMLKNYQQEVRVTEGLTEAEFEEKYRSEIEWSEKFGKNGCNGVQREHNKKLNNGLPILHKVPPKRDYGRYFCIMAEKGGTSHGGLTEKLSLFFHAKKQEVNAYGR